MHKFDDSTLRLDTDKHGLWLYCTESGTREFLVAWEYAHRLAFAIDHAIVNEAPRTARDIFYGNQE